MKTKQTATVLSISALGIGMAHGGIVYTDLYPGTIVTTTSSMSIDLNNDGSNDFQVRFDGLGDTMNVAKPFINSYNTNTADVLSHPNGGAPITAFGTMIDASYMTPNKNGYLYQNYDKNVVGDWPSDADTDAYVGVELISDTGTNFGWVRLEYQATDPNNKILFVKGYAYEDQTGVGIIAGATQTVGAPVIYSSPQSATLAGGATTALIVNALADPTPTYQWKSRPIGGTTFTDVVDGGNISGATTSVLTITGATTANAADYELVVSNSSGTATSDVATIKVIPALLSGPTPSKEQIFLGQSAQFNIAVTSGSTPSYQWRKGGVNLTDGATISGTATANLQVNPVASADTGNYDVVVSTAYGTVTSSVAPLTIVAANGGLYEKTVLAVGPVAYYRLNEASGTADTNAYDFCHGYNGNYDSAMVWGVPGLLPADGYLGFTSGNTAAQFTQNTAGSRITVAPWNLNTNTVTFTAWVKPTGQQNEGAGIVYTRSTNNMVCGVVLGATDSNGNSPLEYNWNDQMGAWSWKSGLSIPSDQWSMVAMVITPTNATLYAISSNAVSSAVNVIDNAVQAFNDYEYIGEDPANTGRTLNGEIDEVAIFNKALSFDQITALSAAASGKTALAPTIVGQPWAQVLYTNQTAHFIVNASGSQPLTYQWRFAQNGVFANMTDSATVSGSQQSEMVIRNVNSANIGNYVVVVSNLGGSVTSSNAPLSLVATNGDAAEKAVLALGPVAFYELNETSSDTTAFDYVGGFNGVYGVGAWNGSSGIPGPTSDDGYPGFGVPNYAVDMVLAANYQSRITLPAFNLNTNAVTLTAWINPDGQQQPYAGLIFTRPASSNKSGLNYSAQTNAMGFPCLGYQWNDDANTYNWNSGLVPPANQWSFVALVVEPDQATIWVINTNGVSKATHSNTHAPCTFESSTILGSDATDAGNGRHFTGMMDNVAIFNRALSGNELVDLVSKTEGLAGAAPVVVQQPEPQTLLSNRTAHFSVSAIGSGDLTYQWQVFSNGAYLNLTDNANVSGSTTSSLTITGVNGLSAGNYRVVVGNSVGSSTSSVSLQLAPGGVYQDAVLTMGAVALYELDELDDPSAGNVVAFDSVSGMNGVYSAAVQNGAQNVAGPRTGDGFVAFGETNAAALFSTNSGSVPLITTPAFNLNTNTVTLTAWVKPNDVQSPYAGIIFSRGFNDDVSGLDFGTNVNGSVNLGYHWNNDIATYSWNSGLAVPVNEWSLVALAVTPTQATLWVMNQDGVASATNVVPHAAAAFAAPIQIGNDPYDSTSGRCFNGVIDEVGIFPNALTGDQLNALYNAAKGTAVPPLVTLQIHPVGAGFQLIWEKGTLLEATDVMGPWTTNSAATSGYSVTPSGTKKFYRILVQ